jgi:hypothetical protein
MVTVRRPVLDWENLAFTRVFHPIQRLSRAQIPGQGKVISYKRLRKQGWIIDSRFSKQVGQLGRAGVAWPVA